MRVDVGRNNVRLAAVPLDAVRCPRVVDGIDQVEQLHRRIAPPKARERDDDPQRSVRVLSAILTYARRIPLDVARIVRHVVERRRQEQDKTRVAADEMRQGSIHRVFGTPYLAGG